MIKVVVNIAAIHSLHNHIMYEMKITEEKHDEIFIVE